MNRFNLLNLVLGRWTRRQRATALYHRAMRFAKKRDHQAAIADYSAIIEMIKVPDDLRAMALYNRSLVYSTTNNRAESLRDLQSILDTKGASANVRQEARRKQLRMEQAETRLDSLRVSKAT